MLTREQFREYLALMAHPETDGEHYAKFCNAILDHDAAMRAKLEAVEEALKMCVEAWEHEGEPSAIGYELAIQKAVAALTPPPREVHDAKST